MKNRYFRILLFFVFFGSNSHAQTPTPRDYAKFPNFPKPAPIFEKTVNYAGSISIDADIYNYKYKDYNLPINLVYNTGGVRVQDVASDVGLNWQLGCSGIISREIRGLPDDDQTGGFLQFDIEDTLKKITNENTVVNSYRISELTDLGSDGSEFFQYSPYQAIPSDLASPTNRRARAGSDWEPDVFHLSFNDMHVSFLLNHKGEAKLIPYQDLKVIPKIDTFTTSYSIKLIKIQGFTVIDSKGVKYNFEDTVISELASSYDRMPTTANAFPGWYAGNTYPQPIITAWAISSIIFPDGHEIKFTYKKEVSYSELHVESQIRADPGDGTGATTFAQPGGRQFADLYSYGKNTELRLEQISDNNIIIKFVPSATPRVDKFGGVNSANPYSIEKVRILQNSIQPKLVKQFILNYHYHNCQAGANEMLFWSPNDNDETDYSKRLMLDNIKEVSLDNKDTITKYAFEYYENEAMPPRGSCQMDFWGYYNGNAAKSPFPKLYIYPDERGSEKFRIYPKVNYNGLSYIIPGVDRNPNRQKIILGSLSKITYQTGGFSKLEYECNDFYFDHMNRLGSGIRLSKITSSDGINPQKDIIKSFEYTKSVNDETISSGLPINMPVFAYIENTHAFRDPSEVLGESKPMIDSRKFADDKRFEFYKNFLTRLSCPKYSSGGLDDINQGYTEITEIINDKGKTIYKYSVPGYYQQYSDAPYNGCPIDDVGGFCDGLFEASISNYVIDYFTLRLAFINTPPRMSPDLKGIDIKYDNTYPFPPSTNYDWNRGLLLLKRDYDVNDHLLSESKYDYRLFYPNGETSPEYLYGLSSGLSDNWKLDDALSPDAPVDKFINGFANVMFFTKYKILTQTAKVLDTKTEKIFSKGDYSNFLTKITRYQYSTKSLNPSIIIEENSKKDSITTILKYPYDLTIEPYSKMVSANIISPIVEKQIWIHGSLNNLYRTNYNSYLNQWVSPLATYYKPESYQSRVRDYPIELDERIIRYDQWGNPAEIQKKDGIHDIYIWINHGQYLGAKISNSDWQSIFGNEDLGNIDNEPDTIVYSRLNLLRTRLKNANVTTYSYIPLVGKIMETDPQGNSRYFEYDNFGRLLNIKDKDYNVMQKFNYHFKL